MSDSIRAEIDAASTAELRAYLAGAARDGTFNRFHRTLRISQRDRGWLELLRHGLSRLGFNGWIYREGTRDVWVLETKFHPPLRPLKPDDAQRTAFARGYFDAEGGLPRDPEARFYIQLCQKDLADLVHLRSDLVTLGVDVGAIHNPSAAVDPSYWRFYVRSASHRRFIDVVGSWHPRKRELLERRKMPSAGRGSG